VKKTPFKLLVLSSALVSTAVLAEDSPHSFSSNVSFVSDYVFRGITQTGDAPAIQGGLDYEHASGFYAGVWGSNIEFGGGTDESIEIDYYVGFAGELGSTGVSYDTSIIYYDYPGQTGDVEFDYVEYYVGLGYEFSGDLAPAVGLGAYYSPDFFGETDEGIAVELSLDLSLPYEVGFGTYVGVQDVDGTDVPGADDGFSYYYWSIGFSKAVGPYELGVAYSDTDSDGGDDNDTVVFSISSSF